MERTMIRTVYVVVVDRRTRATLGMAALRRLAGDVVAEMPRGWSTYRGGEYVKAGTRFLSDAAAGSTRVIKVRGNDHVRNLALAAIARRARVDSVHGHDRLLIGGHR
jgi:hypothetical protein